MFSKILIATDLSEMSERLICSLGNLKKLGTHEMLLIHCMNIRDVGSLGHKMMKMAAPYLEKQRQLLEKQGFKVSADIALGLAQIEINRQAEEHDCSMIAVGSHGESASTEIVMGSMANSIMMNTTKPLLLLRPGLEKGSEQKPCEEQACDYLKNILYTTDFSDDAEHAFEYVKKIAECGAERINLIHVQDSGKIDKHLKHKLEEFNHIDQERLERLKRDIQDCGVKDVHVEIPYGNPKKEIVDFIKRENISLVVMGRQGHGFISELFLGSVSHSVARHSKSSVLLIPAIK